MGYPDAKFGVRLSILVPIYAALFEVQIVLHPICELHRFIPLTGECDHWVTNEIYAATVAFYSLFGI